MKPMIYLDYSATAPLLPEVRAEMLRLMELPLGNPSSLHTPGQTAKTLLNEARTKIAQLIEVPPLSVILTSGGTESNNTIVHTFADCPIFVSSTEHPSVLAPAEKYAQPCIIHTNPKDGYSSISTIDLEMFGDMDETVTEITSDIRFKATPYIPLDGINEKGVFACVNAVHIQTPIKENEEGKASIFFTSALRIILDYAATTEEAIALLESYNLYSPWNYHLFISDSNGDTRTVEVVGDKRYVTSTDILTNHYITEAGPKVPETDNSLARYNTIKAAVDENDSMTKAEVKDVMISVHQENPDHTHFTRWTVIYDMAKFEMVMWTCPPGDHDAPMDYNTSHSYSL